MMQMNVTSTNNGGSTQNWYQYTPEPFSYRQALQNNKGNPQNGLIFGDYHVVSHADIGQDQPKRVQVPKACINCRKMHAACGIERPCRRCVEHGIQDTCIDVPRKKRGKKKATQKDSSSPTTKRTRESESVTTPTVKQEDSIVQTNSPQMFWGENTIDDIPDLEIEPPSKLWENAELLEPFSADLAIFPENEIPTSPFPTEQIFSNFEDKTKDFTQDSFTSFQEPSPEMEQLIKKIEQLKTSNENLKQSLQNVTKELMEVKKEKHVEPAKNDPKKWHVFETSKMDVNINPHLCVSVWKATSTTEKLLVECNDNFIKLMGYPVEVLGKNFTCSAMVPPSSLCPPSNFGQLPQGDWPKKTNIYTASGVKEVYITIRDVRDQTTNIVNYFIVEILEPEFVEDDQ